MILFSQNDKHFLQQIEAQGFEALFHKNHEKHPICAPSRKHACVFEFTYHDYGHSRQKTVYLKQPLGKHQIEYAYGLFELL